MFCGLRNFTWLSIDMWGDDDWIFIRLSFYWTLTDWSERNVNELMLWVVPHYYHPCRLTLPPKNSDLVCCLSDTSPCQVWRIGFSANYSESTHATAFNAVSIRRQQNEEKLLQLVIPWPSASVSFMCVTGDTPWGHPPLRYITLLRHLSSGLP